MRKLVSIALIFIVFGGSLGVPLYEHTCLEEAVTIRTLFTSSDHCENSSAPKSVAETCCGIPFQQELKKDHCCTDDVLRLAMTFSFFEQHQLQAAVLPEAIVQIQHFLFFPATFPTEKQQLFTAHNNDPPISGRERLCKNCMLRL